MSSTTGPTVPLDEPQRNDDVPAAAGRAGARRRGDGGASELSVPAHAVRLTGPLEQRSAWRAARCPMAATMEVIGSRSAVLILREAFYGTTRFDDFARRVGISEPVAAARLRELVGDGLLERVPYQEPGQRTRMGYQLTDKGAELLPVLVALMQWGDRWLAPAGAPVELRHHGCGQPVQAELRCAAGHQPAPDDLDLAVGPGSGLR